MVPGPNKNEKWCHAKIGARPHFFPGPIFSFPYQNFFFGCPRIKGDRLPLSIKMEKWRISPFFLMYAFLLPEINFANKHFLLGQLHEPRCVSLCCPAQRSF
jgi:hypothetical protein